jgi:amino acid adenylation domain-containing protein
MTIFEFLSYLHSLDVKLWIEGDQLRVNAPKGVLTPALRDELTQRKVELIRLLQATDKDSEIVPILPQSRETNVFPLSFSQQRLWFLDQLEPGNVAYNIPVAIRLKGTLQLDVLEHSLSEIVRRHESLRTTFTTVDDKPVQVINPSLLLTIAITDLRALSVESQESEIEKIVSNEAATPFDLAQGPLVRASLLMLSQTEHVFLWTMHHIISDGWSIGVFMRELGILYGALCQGETPPLSELTIQYVDFAEWQQQWLKGNLLEDQLAYWKEQLARPLSVLDLPVDHARPKIQSFSGSVESLTASKALTRQLKDLSRKEDCTLFMLLLAAFDLLLYRYSGLTDIIVGSPIAGRKHTELENLIGFFLNTLALRTNLAGAPSFTELIGRVREVALQAYANQDIPFEKILEELHIERDLSRTPVFQVFFNMLNFEDNDSIDLLGLSAEMISRPDMEAKFDLTLYIRERNDQIQFFLVYNLDLFGKERMAEMARQLEWLLEQIVLAPNKSIDSYSLLTPESASLLPDPTTILEEPAQVLLPQLITEWVKQTPDQIAIEKDTQRWTYRELDEKVTIFANQLIRSGLQPGEVVSVCGVRSFNLVASMLAVLASGGVLLSIDDNLPNQRKHVMLQEASAKVLIYIGHRQENELPWAEQIVSDNIFLLTESSSSLLTNPTLTNQTPTKLPQLRGNDPAYIFFTSGTTGVPKGIQGTHKGLSHFLSWQREQFCIQTRDRAAQLTALSFDVVLRDIFLALVSGATLCLPDDNIQLDAEKTLHWLEDMRVSIVHTVPTLAKTWLAGIPAGTSLPNLRWIFFAGEPLTDTLVHQWRASFPCGQVVNLYGPTETTMAKCFYQVPEDPAPGIQPIGSPLPQTQTLVLNKNNQPCGIGELGEIVIRTPFRTLGYINAAEENSRKFIKNPFRDAEQDQMYYTGDQGRYRPDGQLDILGRMDGQVKIHGIRIELSEIESALCKHHAVQQSVVSVWQVKAEDKRFIAYIVPHPSEFPKPVELRNFLQKNLPDYMIPVGFILLNEIPLTPNGKINREALPNPVQSGFETEKPFTAPANELEELIAGIWADVLGIEKASVLDSFFELGGHSLLMTQIISRIFRIVRVELPLRIMFENPTIRGLSQRIEEARLAKFTVEETAIKLMSHRDNMPLSYSQERMWFLHQLAPESSAYNIFTAARIIGKLNQSFLETSLKSIVKRHGSLRTVFSTVDGQPIQVITSEPETVLSIVDLQTSPTDTLEAAIIELLKTCAIKPFDLVSGPLFKVLLVQLNADEHILAITMHHVISDQWSMGVFTRELIAFYEKLDSDQTPELADLPIQYTDFAQWQREALHGRMLQTQLEYWKKQLQGLQVLELPTDKARPSIQTYNGARLIHPLSPQLIEKMRLLTRSEQVTQFILALTVFNIFLSRYTGQEDITVGIPTANRDRVEIEPLIGTFVNTLVLRTDLSGNPTFKELLHKVRQTTLDALANKDLPFARLVEELRPDRDMSYSPLVQVLFNGINTPFEYPRLRELTITPVVIDKASTQFDLSVTLSTDFTPLLSFSFNTDLFYEETGQRMLTHLMTILEDAVENPDKHLSDLRIMTEKESCQQLEKWNNTTTNYPKGLCLHQLFELQVERTPKAVAVRYGDQQLTFGELNWHADQLAHYLRSLGVGPDICVGICLERSLEMVIGLIGILKAGGTYLPLDPAFPIDRLEYMISDAKAPILLTKSDLLVAQHLIERLPDQDSCIIYLDKDWAAVKAHAGGISGNSLQTRVTPDNLAYIIYTSGSTGKPKGVQLLHKAAVNFLTSMEREPGLTSDDILFSITTLSFDISVLEIFLPLITGASVVLVDREIAFDAVRLAQLLRESKATVMQATPATWYMLKESGWTGDGSLKVLCGGEALSQDLADWLVDRVGSLWNMYGPTETTVWSTIGQIKPGTKRITVGRPIANTQIYILDNNLHPVPIGVPGELFIGGDGVARGYLNQPELTAARFIPNPFINDPKVRIYRTGDKARYLADGQIEILGRADSQVKVRGFRIELGEIESNLNQHPDVQQAVVIVREDSPGNKHLVAYLVPKNEHPIQGKDLRQHLRTSLPEYMIPSFFVTLDKFPMTPNQKVNRKALPRPSQENSAAHGVKVGARNDTEEKLVHIWQDLLHTQSLGVNDNFFDLGGHSLMAVHMFTRIKVEFDVNLPLATLFQEATIEHLANIINTEIKPAAWSSLIEIEPQGNHAPFFCIHGITGDILWFRELARCLAPDYPFYGLQARGLDGVQDPIPRIEEMAGLYIDEIRRLQPMGPYYLGGASFGGTVALEVAQQLICQGEQVALLAIFDHSPPNIKIDTPQDGFMKRLNFIFKVLRNFPNWLREFLHMDPSQILMRVRRKFRLARKFKAQSENGAPELFEAADLIDFASELSSYRQRLISNHYQAMKMYNPKSYSGNVTLFRATIHPLLNVHDPEFGWQILAPGQVSVHDIPSSHEGMFRTPNVQYLAMQLKACIDQASSQGSP